MAEDLGWILSCAAPASRVGDILILLSKTRSAVAIAIQGSIVVAACLAIASCVARNSIEPSPPPSDAPDSFPQSTYEIAVAEGEIVYEIDAGDSLVVIYAYRTGALSRLGHDHVIASRSLRGYVLRTLDAGDEGANVRADLFTSLAAMTVDEEDLRSEALFESEVSESDRSGTRANMLNSLQAANFPFATAHVEASLDNRDLASGEISLQVTITLHGVSKSIEIPAVFSIDFDSLSVESAFTLLQSDFGIKPFSVFGGALAVQDEIALRLKINAVRLDSL